MSFQADGSAPLHEDNSIAKNDEVAVDAPVARDIETKERLVSDFVSFKDKLFWITLFCPCIGTHLLAKKAVPLEVFGVTFTSNNVWWLLVASVLLPPHFVMIGLIAQSIQDKYRLEQDVSFTLAKAVFCGPCLVGQISSHIDMAVNTKGVVGDAVAAGAALGKLKSGLSDSGANW